MSFELKADEALRDGIQRIAEKELEQIRKLLGAHTKDSRDDIVHESRRGRARRPARAVTDRPYARTRLVRPVIWRGSERNWLW